MKEKFIGTWKDAFFASPGPASVRKAMNLALKGLCMGSADVIPGVSGGTIALITGIYEDLIGALRSIDTKVVQKLLALDVKGIVAKVHVRFLLALFSGIFVAILSLARLMNYLLHHHPVPTWSLFFGLIAASTVMVGKHVSNWFGTAGISFVAGIIAATMIVNLIPMHTPEDLWFIFLCGFVAICAMILPGISGAFILLILGKYEYVTGALKNPFLPQNLIVILVFCIGCAIGLLGFSRVLNYLLQKFHNLTLAFLTGLIAGSMQKIWPWKEVIETQVIRGKAHIIWGGPTLPPAVDQEFFITAGLAVVGFVAVLLIERLSIR
ncbi:Arginine/ornithine antiporter ArcD [Olavius sp. associated proteobacterium Delta 1]|nr:Arginine/ornithine antiporter ArcD [Olavius sp. associated proteobacterium Delta 1]